MTLGSILTIAIGIFLFRSSYLSSRQLVSASFTFIEDTLPPDQDFLDNAYDAYAMFGLACEPGDRSTIRDVYNVTNEINYFRGVTTRNKLHTLTTSKTALMNAIQKVTCLNFHRPTVMDERVHSCNLVGINGWPFSNTIQFGNRENIHNQTSVPLNPYSVMFGTEVTSSDHTLLGWAFHPGHRDNLLADDVFGVATVRCGSWWAQSFTQDLKPVPMFVEKKLEAIDMMIKQGITNIDDIITQMADTL